MGDAATDTLQTAKTLASEKCIQRAGEPRTMLALGTAGFQSGCRCVTCTRLRPSLVRLFQMSMKSFGSLGSSHTQKQRGGLLTPPCPSLCDDESIWQEKDTWARVGPAVCAWSVVSTDSPHATLGPGPGLGTPVGKTQAWLHWPDAVMRHVSGGKASGLATHETWLETQG